MCKQIDHFPEETDYEADPSEYFLREYLISLFSYREILFAHQIDGLPLLSLRSDHEEKSHQAFLPMFS